MKLLLAILLMATQLYAGFGGSRGGGGGYSGGRSSSFGGSRSFSAPRSAPSPSRSSGGSYFGGSRSSGSSATITRPVKPSAPTSSSSTSHPPIINNHYGGGYGGGSGPGFFTGFLFGNMFHSQPQVIVANPGVGGVPGQTVVVEETHGFFYYMFRVIAWMAILGIVGLGVLILIGIWRDK